MNGLETDFSSKLNMEDDDELQFDDSFPEPGDELPENHSYQEERQYLRTMIKTADLWKLRLKKEKPDKNWVKFLFSQNEKLKTYQKYVLFDGSNSTYDDLSEEDRKEITKIGKIIKLTRAKICSKYTEPAKILLYIKKVYSGIDELVGKLEMKKEETKTINMIIRKIKHI